jgi:hypothetical protein
VQSFGSRIIYSLVAAVLAFLSFAGPCRGSDGSSTDPATKSFCASYPEIAANIIAEMNRKLLPVSHVATIKFDGIRIGTATFGDVSFSGRFVCSWVSLKVLDPGLDQRNFPEWSRFFVRLPLSRDLPSFSLIDDKFLHDASSFCQGIR